MIPPQQLAGMASQLHSHLTRQLTAAGACLLAQHSLPAAACTAWGQASGHAARPLQARSCSTWSSSNDEPMYPTHVALNPVQKGAVALFAALGALYRPSRADLVATVGETWGLAPVVAMRDRMQATASGRLILQERPRVTSAAMARCWDLPAGTFGRAYADFMGQRGFQADERPPVRFVDDEELAYVVARAREVHDFWHVLFDCHTNVFGELALKALEFVQTGLPMTGMAVVGGQLKLSPQDRAVLWSSYLPWAARTGLRCADLLSIYYEQHLEEDLEELRTRWRITPAPPPPEHLAAKLATQVKAAEGAAPAAAAAGPAGAAAGAV